MKITFPWNPTPAPSPSPAVYVDLTIIMYDSYGDGWNGNILGFRQNGNIIATFGSEFTFGKLYGPLTVKIPGNLLTQIVVVQYGSWRNEIGFIVKSSYDSIIYQYGTQ